MYTLFMAEEKGTSPIEQIQTVEQLFTAYYGMVCNTIYRLLKDRTKTEDVAQEVFAELWVKWDQIKIHTSVTAYLKRMAITRALNYIRDSKKHSWDEIDNQDFPVTSPAVAPEALLKLEAEELRQVIENAIEDLPEKCRVVFLLSREQEYSYQEIAHQLGISVKTVENQIGKALKLLRTALASHRGMGA